VRRLQRGGLPLAEFDLLAGLPGLVHAVSTRHGGVSPAPFDTLNLGLSCGDAPENVAANRRRLAEAVGARPEQLATCFQVHGAQVVHVDDQPAEVLRREHADILITNRPGRFLMLRFADCVPLLLVDPRRRALALAHAGWRGTAADVAVAAVRALSEQFGSAPRDLLAGVGPAIGPCCYEVGEEVAAHFAHRPGGVRRDGQRIMLDLWALNREALLAAGVPAAQIELSALCTRCHSRDFFSHRAAGGGPSGRFSLIASLQ